MLNHFALYHNRCPRLLRYSAPCVAFCLRRPYAQDMTQVDLESALPQTTVMVVSVTGSTTSGRPLSEEDLQQCLKVRETDVDSSGSPCDRR